LKVTYYGGTTTNALVAYDGNGNVMALVDASNGNVCARYEYGPFAEPIRVSGPMGKLNPVRFSSKYTDDESGFLYYGYRYYSPGTGRWPSRDHIGERSGLNLYGVVGNNPICRYDVCGLYGKGDHHTLTTMALSSVSGWLGTTPKCISRIQKILLDANDSQDGWGVGGNLWDNYRHYNRDTTQTGVVGDTAYGNYLASEQAEFATKLQNPTKANCKAALQALGRLSHSWQDFFIHSIRRDGLGGKENSSFPGWTAWSVGVTGNPSSRGNFFPSSYSVTGGGEHPPTDEPVLPSSAEWQPRFNGALTYTTQEFMGTLFQWLNGCRCSCEQSWWY
ncbi:MAG: RHS repeat-associated core domain-containing protein, partial [Verrucomicrobia bacterium]|nr:RHS repeat-associated core domain-containing protein [Verrucomicrobiota bacterium]